MTRRLIGQLHLWTALILCVPLVLIGLTGSVLVFEDELRGLFAGEPPPAVAGEARPAAEIIAAARAIAPAGSVASLYMPPAEPGHLATVRLVPPRRDGAAGAGDALRIDVDPVSLKAFVRHDDFLRQVFFLHSTLLMKNREGRQLVGWLGVAMLLMGISGLVNWWPRRAQWRGAFGVARDARGFRLHRELHGATGIWALLVFVTVSFAGVALAFPESIRAVVNLVLPARDLRAAAAAIRVEPLKGAEPVGADAAMAIARQALPDARPVVVFLPARLDQPLRVGMLRATQQRGEPAATVIVDPWARRSVEVLDPRGFSTGEAMLSWQHSVHAGRGLGWVWKILVCLTGLLPLLFTVTGVAMWWRKRRPRPQAAVPASI